MNFYVVSNGWAGDGYCKVYVSAENETRAKELASEVFKKSAQRNNRLAAGSITYRYPETYWLTSHLRIDYTLSGNAEGVIDEVDY